MGREIKRVPLDFDHPIEEKWAGFINPHYEKCPDCRNGYTRSGEWLEAIARFLSLAAHDGVVGPARGGTWPHPFLTSFYSYPGPPDGDLQQLVNGLNGDPLDKEPGFMGTNTWEMQAKLMEVAGLPEDWNICKTCAGEGIHPDIKEAYEAWESTEVPTGEGWQVWETVSEGSPVSPVFATAEELAQHLSKHGDAWCQKRPHEDPPSIESARAFVNSGWGPSMLMGPGGVTNAYGEKM